MSDDGRPFNDQWAGALGPIYDRVIANVDVHLAGVDELLMEGVSVTVREAAGVAGWVGIVDADLSEFSDFKLELRLPNETAECGVLFVVAGEVMDRTCIRGSGRPPGHGPKVRSETRLASLPRDSE